MRAPEGGTCITFPRGGQGFTPPHPPLEENADFSDFSPERAHLLFLGVYREFLHHNDRLHLDRGFLDAAVWQSRWRRLATQSDRWYATPSGAVARRFTAMRSAECQRVLIRIWSSERTLIFAHITLTNMLGVQRAREIRVRITRRMIL